MASQDQKGFTLIEVMIVVVIIAILAAVAIPNYQDYVTRGRITEAIAGLADARTKIEQYFQDNRAYPAGCVIQPTAPGPTEVQLTSLKMFDLSCSNMSANTYTVTATGNQAMAGFTYTVDQQNVRTSAFAGTGASKGYTPATPNTCWVVRKGGLC
jgi:type IV pilus assembly protein PilE